MSLNKTTIFNVCLGILLGGVIRRLNALNLGELNVCQTTETYLEDYLKSYTSTIRVKTYTWCLGVPPRCTKYITETRTRYKKDKRIKTKNVYKCCNGYSEVGDKCIAICNKGCNNGVCIAPDVCDCHAGWRGILCDSRCPIGTWGDNCLRKCSCQNGGRCDVTTGQCYCSPGFHGPKCEYSCPEGSFGAHCSQRCKCIHGQGKCDTVSGRCQCFPGYQGSLCEKRCTSSYGTDCVSECMCQNDGHCDPEDGSCICQQGWMGNVCANTCPEGYFGYRCSQKCSCYNGGSCNHISGACTCKPGYIGTRCQVQCPYGKYGEKCAEKCLCENNAMCYPIDGTCICTKGFMGPHCQFKACPHGWYGKDCKQRCHCNVNSSKCDTWTGECSCNDGFVGPKCEQTCGVGWYGVNCSSKCVCDIDHICNHTHGCVESSVTYGQKNTLSESPQAIAGLLIALSFILIIIVSICFIVYYRRRYKRLKQTNELMVQYRVVDPGSVIPESSEEGACGRSDNPAYRLTSSQIKRHEAKECEAREGQPLQRVHGTDDDDRYPHAGCSSLPNEPPPPYSPTPQLPNTIVSSPPPYTAGPHTAHLAETSHLSLAVTDYGGVSDDEDIHTSQNTRNEYREATPI